MADMRLTARRFRDLDDGVGGNDLSNHRTRLKECLPVVASGFLHSLLLILDDRIVFTVEARASVKFLDNIHGLHRLAVVQRLIIRGNRSDERLKRYTALRIQFLQIIKIIARKSAPEAVVNICIGGNLTLFEIKRLRIGHTRIILKRHIDHSGIPAKGGCRRSVLIILAPLKSRIIQMRVRVDRSREYIFCSSVDHLFRLWFRTCSQNCGDLAVFDRYITFRYGICRNDLTILD